MLHNISEIAELLLIVLLVIRSFLFDKRLKELEKELKELK